MEGRGGLPGPVSVDPLAGGGLCQGEQEALQALSGGRQVQQRHQGVVQQSVQLSGDHPTLQEQPNSL